MFHIQTIQTFIGNDVGQFIPENFKKLNADNEFKIFDEKEEIMMPDELKNDIAANVQNQSLVCAILCYPACLHID